ncbi:manganese efflux pump MntP family protein [Atrimonas thermophila]|uniref:manganese efflux pump MntP n=1 Tax=Atrimonas thermophila TaxID=3064161 RepID=UPI00399CC8EA
MLEVFVVAFGLGLDAFSLSLVFGMCQKVCPLGAKLRLSLSFGAFQFGMPILGFFAGATTLHYVSSFDHLVAFLILLFVGIKMFWEGLKNRPEENVDFSKGIPLLLASLATSIDALAVGFSFAFMGNAIYARALIIGVVCALMSYLAVSLGHRFGKAFIPHPELLGGVAIVAVGVKILLQG